MTTEFRERQLRLPNFRISKPQTEKKETSPADPELTNLCRGAFEKVLSIWRESGLTLPQEQPAYRQCPDFPDDHLEPFISPLWTQNISDPMVCEIKIPEKFKPLVEVAADKSNFRRKLWLSKVDPLTVFEDRPIWPANDEFGFLEWKDEFYDWQQKTSDEWWNQPPRFEGWSVQYGVRCLGDTYHLRFSSSGKLIRFSSFETIPVEKVTTEHIDVPTLYTRASFRGNSLISLWQEVPNGTFFEDPRGPKEQIWPKWLKPNYLYLREFETEKMNWPANEELWEFYLERIKRGERVLSGRTFKEVRQTEKQAIANLERWREYVYNVYPQVFHFYKSNNEQGSVGKLGYPRQSKFGGHHVAKNPQSYQELTLGEIKEKLASWQPKSVF